MAFFKHPRHYSVGTKIKNTLWPHRHRAAVPPKRRHKTIENVHLTAKFYDLFNW